MPSQTVTIYLWPVTSTSWLLPGFWIMTIIHSTDWTKYQSILKLCMSNLTLVSLELNFFLKIQIDQRSLTSRCLQFILAYTVCITKNSLICSQPLFIMNCSVHFLIHIWWLCGQITTRSCICIPTSPFVTISRNQLIYYKHVNIIGNYAILIHF